jgi:hypothetical protein
MPYMSVILIFTWAIPLTKVGYTVHPVPAPLSTLLLVNRSVVQSERRTRRHLRLIEGVP